MSKGWSKGVSGNPGGRPRGARALAAEAITDEDAIAVLKIQLSIAKGVIPPGVALGSLTANDVSRAAVTVLDRLWGKPHQTVDGVHIGIGVDINKKKLPPLSVEQLRVLAALDIDLGDDENDDSDGP